MLNIYHHGGIPSHSDIHAVAICVLLAELDGGQPKLTITTRLLIQDKR